MPEPIDAAGTPALNANEDIQRFVADIREWLRKDRAARHQDDRAAEQKRRGKLIAALNPDDLAKMTREFYRDLRIQQVTLENAVLDKQIGALSSVLEWTLPLDDTLPFERLRLPGLEPALEIPSKLASAAPEPDEQLFVGRHPRLGWARAIPGLGRYFVRSYDRALERHWLAHDAWSQAETARLDQLAVIRASHAAAVKQFRDERRQRSWDIDRLSSTYGQAKPSAVSGYVSIILERSVYPEGFPQAFEVGYDEDSRLLLVEYELPTSKVIPSEKAMRYIRTRDEITVVPRKLAEIRALYADLIASVALRTLHEIFESDQGDHIAVCAFNGFVNTVDPATGRDIRPHLISVRTTKAEFAAIDLARADKGACLQNLGAKISTSAAEAQAIRPIVEFNMVDPRFVDQRDIGSLLSSRPNLIEMDPFAFEQLVAELFTRQGLDVKLTRSSRDGGVDCVAFDHRPVIGGQFVIQAKRYRHTVGVSAVRDLYGTMQHEGANKGILVTTSGYGPDAYEFVRNKPIELINGSGLLHLLREQGIEARIVMPSLS